MGFSDDSINYDFINNMPGGAFVYRAGENNEIIYVNQEMIRLLECDDFDDFMAYTGGTFEGIVNDATFGIVKNQIEIRREEQDCCSGYVFYSSNTKKGNVRRIVNHWSYVQDEQEGGLFYNNIFIRGIDSTESETDRLTGLTGRKLFKKYVDGMNKKDGQTDSSEYAIVYLNLVNFKLLNINRGVDEGDRCLKVIADTLSRVYAGAYISRISDDHFAVFDKFEGIQQKTNKANVIFRDTYGSRFNVICKFGIYKFELNNNFNVESALSFAKIACDYVKHDPKSDVSVYSDKLADEVNATEYVIRKIDEAIKNDWIKIYYQPVIRSLTGQLCGMESLVRWQDPQIGFLMPDRFITVLEKEQCIHKLDSYVVEKVCQCIHERIKNKLPVVPVSVNFSRLDFIMCNMLEVVERAVEKYDIPRDYIHIEITESMIVKDEELMRDVISKFRESGYEIWMDDFGSGYSSLTLLKDYKFDMLKLDMRFLRPFTEKSKSIVRATIQMAKDIGIKTLAEGVETQEHLDFLREIGCERIQGYYYGKPEPIEDMFEHLQEKRVDIERRKWRHFYEIASFNVRATDTPIYLVEDDGENFKALYMNRQYMRQVFGEETPCLEEINHRIYKTGSPLMIKYREFADIVHKSDKPESFYYTENGNILSLTVEELASIGGRYLYKCSVLNITLDTYAEETEMINAKLKEINQLFEGVHVFDLKNNKLVPLLGGNKYIDKNVIENDELDKSIDYLAREVVFPMDAERYRAYMDITTLKERVKASPNGYIYEKFRIKGSDGNYRWIENYMMMIAGTGTNEYLSCIKPFDEAVSTVSDEAMKNDPEYSNLWNNLIWNSSIKFFWKDKDRRFRGASRAFLEYYGLNSLDEILEKNDEDMHWHIEEEPYKTDEIDVINKGEHKFNVQGKCIVKGVIHNIICNKMPYYENGKIAGLVGYFEDIDDELVRFGKKSSIIKLDSVTGLMNAQAFNDSMIDYAIQYNEKKNCYGLIVLTNKRYDSIRISFGDDFSNKVLKAIGEGITEVIGQTCAVARVKESIFAILTYVETKEELLALDNEIKEKLNSINEVEGNRITLRIKSEAVLRTEEGISDDNIYAEAFGKLMD